MDGLTPVFSSHPVYTCAVRGAAQRWLGVGSHLTASVLPPLLPSPTCSLPQGNHEVDVNSDFANYNARFAVRELALPASAGSCTQPPLFLLLLLPPGHGAPRDGLRE